MEGGFPAGWVVTRRSFFSRLAAVSTVPLVSTVTLTATPVERPDDFRYHGYRVTWGGWRDPANQFLTIGFWHASPLSARGPDYVSTTLNGCTGQEYGPLYCIDLGWYDRDTWPSPAIVPRMTPAERDSLKQRACADLLRHLDTLNNSAVRHG
jgi:hypothetical protein